VSGGLPLAAARDPYLAGLPKDALEELARSYDQVLVKYPVPDGSQDAFRNQIASKPASKAGAVDSGASETEEAHYSLIYVTR
jgi:hypothetical protein